jgi:tyrosine-protein kinase Etk/Wzc
MDYQDRNPFQEETIDIRKYLFLIFRNWYWFLISGLIALSIAYYINRFSEPVYNVGGATVMVRHERMRAGGIETFLPGIELLNNRTTIQNQMEILRSFSLNRRVIEELDFDITYVAIGRFKNAEMYLNSDIKVNAQPDKVQRTGYPIYVTILSENEYRLEIDDNLDVDRIMQFGEQFVHDQFSFNIELVSNNLRHHRYYFIINNKDALSNRYRSNLNINVNNPETGSVLFLSSIGKVPQQEADYLNKLMEMFIRVDLEEKSQTAVNTINFIDNQLIDIGDSLQYSENAILAFQNQQGISNLSREGNIYFTRLERLQSEKAELVIKDRYFNYLLEYLSGKSGYRDIVAPSAIGIGDPLLNSLISQLNQLHSDRNLLSLSVSENNHRLIQSDQIIGNVTETLLENIRSMIGANQIALTDVDNRVNAVERDVARLPLVERQMLNIERRYNLNSSLFNYLMEKRAEASIAQAAQVSDNRILDYARSSAAIIMTPKKNKNYSIAILAGLGLPLMLFLIADFFNNKITDKTYIGKKTNVPILGSIGHSTIKTEIPVKEKPNSAMAESFRALRTNLHYVLRENGSKTISISSTISGEGKTFTAANLATIIAMSGKRTLLMGLDLRRPKINSLFNLDGDVGLSTYLIGMHDADEILVESAQENLDLVTSGPVPPNPSELLQSEKMAVLLQEMKKRYEYIIFDTPPVAVVSDALIVNQYADMTIFVIRQNFSNKNVIELINGLYYNKEIKNLSILINDVKASGYYGYGYNNYGYGNVNVNAYYSE